MYTFNRVISDRKDLTARRRIVNVEFIDGETLHNREMQFSLTETTDAIKKRFKEYLDELNAEIVAVTDLTYTEPTPDEPTQAELDKQAWQADRAKLATTMELVRDGVFDGTETPITNLQAKVKANFKAEYLD